MAKFSKHEGSHCHKDAILHTVTLSATTSNVSELLSTQLAKERLERRKCFLKVLSNFCFLSRQGLAFLGDADESDSNFMQLIRLCSEDNSKLVQWIQQKKDKYTSGEIQNEMIKVMALCVLRQITEQMCPTLNKFRWVNENSEIQEEFVGLYEVEYTSAEKFILTPESSYLKGAWAML